MLEPQRRGGEAGQAGGGVLSQGQARLEADGESYRAEDAAVGKAHDRGKDSTEARRPERQFIPDTSDRNSMSQPPCGRIAHRVEPCADARATEEPDAGKLHVRDCTGGAG